MRVRTYVLTIAGALALSFSLLAQQPPAGPPQQAPAPPPLGPPAPFYPHVVATGLRGGYQVVATDMNKDGKVDLIGLGLAESRADLVREPVLDAARDHARGAADGQRGRRRPRRRRHSRAGARLRVQPNSTQNPGKIAILTANNKDPRELWTLKQIDELNMTSHRVRFVTINGQKLLASAPIITAESADGFTNSNHTVTPLHIYRPPAWKRETVTEESRGVVHGLVINDWNGDGRADIVTTGYMGDVRAHPRSQRELDAHARSSRAIRPSGRAAASATSPSGGSAASGSWSPTSRSTATRWWSTCRPPTARGRATSSRRRSTTRTRSCSWTATATAPAEIVSGGTRGAPGTPRGTKPGVFFYKAADAAGQKWDRMVLDDGIAANSCVAADFNGDRKMDLACIDAGNPWAFKWYENTRK